MIIVATQSAKARLRPPPHFVRRRSGYVWESKMPILSVPPSLRQVLASTPQLTSHPLKLGPNIYVEDCLSGAIGHPVKGWPGSEFYAYEDDGTPWW